MNRPEQKIQTAIVVAFRRRFDALTVHCPNGGARTELEALNFKDAGTTAGVPDLLVFSRDGRLLLIEVKAKVQARERGVPPCGRILSASDSQKIVIPDLRRRGFTVAIVDNVEDAVTVGETFGLGPKPAPAPRSPEALATGF